MSYFTCVWSLMLLLFTISCIGCKWFGVETIANVIWLVYSYLVILCPFPEGCLIMHIHVVYCITCHCDCYDSSFWCSLLVGYLAWSSLLLVGCLLFVWLLQSVACCRLFWLFESCVEGTSFDVLLVIIATITISHSGFRWLVGVFSMSVLFLAYCLLLLWLLQWVMLVSGAM